MLVQGPAVIRSTTGVRRTAGRSADVGLGFAAVPSDGPAGTPAAPRLSTLAAMGAVLAAQERADEEGSRRRALRRGGRLLDRLDALHLALLEGGSAAALRRELEATLAEASGASDARPLDDVLREIELRAAVELAKLERGEAG